MTFNATTEAVRQIRLALDKRKTPNAALRIGVRSGGCDGFKYHIEFWDDDPTDKDNIFVFQNIESDKIDEIKIYIDKKSIIYLADSELVWAKELLQYGFKINNPKVKTFCGCKESFHIE